MLVVIIAVIAIATAALFYQWRSSHSVSKRAEKASVGKVHSASKKSGETGGKKKKEKSGAVDGKK